MEPLRVANWSAGTDSSRQNVLCWCSHVLISERNQRRYQRLTYRPYCPRTFSEIVAGGGFWFWCSILFDTEVNYSNSGDGRNDERQFVCQPRNNSACTKANVVFHFVGIVAGACQFKSIPTRKPTYCQSTIKFAKRSKWFAQKPGWCVLLCSLSVNGHAVKGRPEDEVHYTQHSRTQRIGGNEIECDRRRATSRLGNLSIKNVNLPIGSWINW